MKREYASKDGSVRIVETPTDVLRLQNFIYGIKTVWKEQNGQ